ncbi:MAG: enoyl-CoA hydratase-related protein [Dehalococcoidia bacterium]
MTNVLTEKQNHILLVTINRPEVMNALDYDTFLELSKAFTDFRDDDDLWVAVLTGAGERAFSSGADLKAMAGGPHPDSWTGEWYEPLRIGQLHRGLQLWKPVIAAVNGHCHAGGFNLVLACDIRIAAEHATFSLAQVKRGIMPGNGGTQRLPPELPYAVAMEMLLYGKSIDTQTAFHYGLVNRIVPMAALQETALDYARRLCDESAPLAVRAIKQAVLRGAELPLEQGIALESFIGERLRMTEDAKEGPLAFREHRKPVWRAR